VTFASPELDHSDQPRWRREVCAWVDTALRSACTLIVTHLSGATLKVPDRVHTGTDTLHGIHALLGGHREGE